MTVALVALIIPLTGLLGAVVAVFTYRANVQAKRNDQQIDVIKVGQSTLMESLEFVNKDRDVQRERIIALEKHIATLDGAARSQALRAAADADECERKVRHLTNRVVELEAEVVRMKGAS